MFKKQPVVKMVDLVVLGGTGTAQEREAATIIAGMPDGTIVKAWNSVQWVRHKQSDTRLFWTVTPNASLAPVKVWSCSQLRAVAARLRDEVELASLPPVADEPAPPQTPAAASNNDLVSPEQQRAAGIATAMVAVSGKYIIASVSSLLELTCMRDCACGEGMFTCMITLRYYCIQAKCALCLCRVEQV